MFYLQAWFPWEFDRFSKPAANRRGYGLYGPHFLRYCTRNGATRVLGLSAADRKRVAEGPRDFPIAPWHYHPCHCARDAEGIWSLRKLLTFKDSEDLVFSLTSQNSSAQAFIDKQSLFSGLMRGEVDDRYLPGSAL